MNGHEKMRFTCKAILHLVVALAFVTVGCDLGLQEQTGSLSVRLNSARTFDSPVDTEITGYEVTLTHSQTAEERSVSVSRGDSIDFEELMTGLWEVEVNATNEAGSIVAHGSTQIQIRPNTTSIAHVALSFLEGEGGLHLSLGWAEGVFATPEVSAVLKTSLTDPDPLTLTLNLVDEDSNGKSEGAVCEQSVPAGTYILFVSLTDSTTDYETGRVDVISIMESETEKTAVSYDFASTAGSSGIVIDDPEDPTFELSVTASMEYAPIETMVTFSADVTDADSYSWFIDGEPTTAGTSYEMTVGFGSVGDYTVSCIATKDGAMASGSAGIRIGEFDPEGSYGYYYDALVFLNSAPSLSSPVVNLEEAYSLLSKAVALDPENSDAALALCMMDLMGMMTDDAVINLMQSGLGVTDYPEDFNELYADIYSGINISSFVPNGYNTLYANYGTDSSPFYMPHIVGMSSEELNTMGPMALVMQMFENFMVSGLSTDVIPDAILSSLGRSLDRVTAVLDSLGDSALYEISDETFGFAGSPSSYFYDKAEAQLLASMLYQVRSMAGLLQAIDLSLSDSVIYSMFSGPDFLLEGNDLFADNFLGADAEAEALILAARDDMLTAIDLLQGAMARISSRQPAQEGEPSMFISPDNPYYSDQFMSWEEFQSLLVFFDRYLQEIEGSIISESYDPAILPTDFFAEPYYDFTTLMAFIEYYTSDDCAAWPTEADVSFASGGLSPQSFKAVGIGYGALFDPETSLLSLLLERAPDGDPVIYTYDQVSTVEVATSYDESHSNYYVRVPDISLNGFIDSGNLPLSLEDLNLLVRQSGSPFVGNPGYLEENPDGSISWYLSLDMISWAYMQLTGSSSDAETMGSICGSILAYHSLTPYQESAQSVVIPFGSSHYTDITGPGYGIPIIAYTQMDIASAGSFWDGVAWLGDWSYSTYADAFTDHSRFEAPTQILAIELELDSSYRPDEITRSLMGSEFWVVYRPDHQGKVSIKSFQSHVIYHNGDVVNNPVSIEVAAGDTFFVMFDTSSSDYFSVSAIWEDELGDISSEQNALSLAAGNEVTGRAGGHYENRIYDYFSITPSTDEVTLIVSSPDDDQYPPEMAEYYDAIPYRSMEWKVADGASSSWIGGNKMVNMIPVTPGVEYILRFGIDGLDYSLMWQDSGASL